MSRQLVHNGLVDLLESDPRPTFIVASSNNNMNGQPGQTGPSGPPAIIYRNPSLTSYPQLLELLLATNQENHHIFWNWISHSSAVMTVDHASRFEYLGLTWTKSVLEDLWVVVGANDEPPSMEPRRKIRQPIRVLSVSDESGPSSPKAAQPRMALTREASNDADTQMAISGLLPHQVPFLDVVNGVGWDATPLGPMDKWPPRLLQTFRQIISDSRPIAVYWGKSMTTVYNEAFSKLCGSQHPAALGQPAANIWPESDFFPKATREMRNQGQHIYADNESRIFIETVDGPLVETYVRWSLVPIVEADEFLGHMLPILETTSTRLWERRMKMLIELGDQLVTARDAKSYWRKVIDQLERCDPTYDSPLAILYSVSDNTSPLSPFPMKNGGSKVCRLEGALGVPDGHPIAPKILYPGHTMDGLAAMFTEAFRTRHPVLLQTEDGTLPRHLLDGLRWRGFGDACRAAIICPITPTREENVMGLLVLGLNPRRPYDNDYRQYVSLLCQKLTTSLASTVLLEEETRRGRNAAEQAAYDQAMLKEKLARSKQEASESMERFKAVAEFIPVGMCFGDENLNISFANDAWYRIMGHPMGHISPAGFQECIVDDDLPHMARAYKELERVPAVTFNFRVKRRRDSPPVRQKSPLLGGHVRLGDETVLDDRVERHVLASAKAERGPDGTITRILTCLTDVTAHKLAAEEAVRKAHESENLKRMAELATVGMYDMSLDGHLLGANNVFYELCGIDKVDDLAKTILRPWETCIVEEDRPVLQRCLSQLAKDGQTQTAELRLKTRYAVEDGQGNRISRPRWAMATFMPVMTSENVLHSITGCLSDVSAQKWQWEMERQRKEQALESKRQQETFIDMTSHEMRNPLGAILHCADAIASTLAKVQEMQSTTPLTPERSDATAGERSRNATEDKARLIDECIDSAEIIITCAQHQKRIVDDILTMSKLDSQLLAITPCTVDPIEVAQNALKMFEVEARRVDLQLDLVIDASFNNLGLKFLDFDPSRVQQVLINLLTNALKFTKSSPVRKVEVRIKASRTRPTDDSSLVQFMPRSCSKESEHEQSALVGRTNPIYLAFEVKDSGKGLGEEEKSHLFKKFQQANEKTHVKYGGSGLGLFISRRLTELQNGAIGVSSKEGVGSNFAFFIEAYTPTEASRKEAEASAAAAAAMSSESVAETNLTTAMTAGTCPVPTEGQDPGADSRLDGILIVEDNIINQRLTRRGLADRGFTVDVANHGIEALEKLEASRRASLVSTAGSDMSTPSSFTPSLPSQPRDTAPREMSPRRNGKSQDPMQFNLILMDIEMPVQDGLTCTRRIRQLEREGRAFSESGRRIPIIAVSANARPEQIAEAKKAGCDDVLVKPYRMHELVEKMQLVVRRTDGLSSKSPP